MIGILVLAECCRRVTGIPILVVAGCFVIYAFATNLANGKALYKVLRSVIYNLFYTTNGIIGTPIGVCSTYIVLFIIFGAFLEATGIADFFISCANCIAGSASGGPAKVAVISSALCGMVSGSSVGNTVTTGSVTIPMMKKTGYPGEFAGAVEAAASTGGQIILLIPLAALVYLIIAGYTMSRAAIIATLLCIVVSMFDKEHRMSPKKFLDALETGARNTLSIAVACGIAGIIAGVVTMTGLGQVFISAIVGISHGHLMIALILTMLCCIILGMGVPTTATYIIMATTCAPILTTGMGLNTLCASMFVFYFGIVADITPPVALAAYAGSAIAKSDPMRTALNASKLAIAAFLIPYMFCLNPAMLLIDTTAVEFVVIIITSVIGMYAISAALEGYMLTSLNPVMRIILLAAGLMLIYPGTVTDIVGINQFLSTNAYNSSYDAIFEAQREVILDLAKKPCIIVGRCSNMILREEGIDSFDIFLYADLEHRRKRALELNENGKMDIDKYIARRDRLRNTYYHAYTGHLMGDARDYNICLDTGKIGMNECIVILAQLLKDKVK